MKKEEEVEEDEEEKEEEVEEDEEEKEEKGKNAAGLFLSFLTAKDEAHLAHFSGLFLSLTKHFFLLLSQPSDVDGNLQRFCSGVSSRNDLITYIADCVV